MDTTPTTYRKPRTDAARNRARILDTALRHFAERGAGTSLEAIAKDAGVGPATLYRHFPNREALLAAALETPAGELLSGLEELRAVEDPDEGLRQWLLALEKYLSTFTGLPAPVLAALSCDDSPLAVSCQELVAVTDEFLAAAQRDGTARATVQGRDLFLAALFLAWTGSVPVEDAALPTLRQLVETGYSTR
ncbi:TetR/AcrR family transcriptional regulator [Streptomyces roseirectus]|uniref:TetR/AcrR family transcriptional regulator n=1 Tax=Streptomyces roseirectus TaxID=2768066 RepID=A0A7H0IQK2_9ACTN|nr:TetR/AcrR family transcriptional regulator [Streptomyces roseirectus]QNP75068.1 TetR/AcrR family transcriptional regulator [Streptomyces roseirectus]